MLVVKKIVRNIMCASFMQIGSVVFPHYCHIGEEAVAWSYNKKNNWTSISCVFRHVLGCIINYRWCVLTNSLI